jgi:hypothetical protein
MKDEICFLFFNYFEFKRSQTITSIVWLTWCTRLVMGICLVWIQPHTHWAILKYIFNMINSFLCSSTNYLENRLLPIDLIIGRNHGYDKEDARDIKDEEPKWRAQQVEDPTQFRIGGDPIQFGILESELKSNSEFRTTLYSNWHSGYIWTPIWTFYIFM